MAGTCGLLDSLEPSRLFFFSSLRTDVRRRGCKAPFVATREYRWRKDFLLGRLPRNGEEGEEEALSVPLLFFLLQKSRSVDLFILLLIEEISLLLAKVSLLPRVQSVRCLAPLPHQQQEKAKEEEEEEAFLLLPPLSVSARLFQRQLFHPKLFFVSEILLVVAVLVLSILHKVISGIPSIRMSLPLLLLQLLILHLRCMYSTRSLVLLPPIPVITSTIPVTNLPLILRCFLALY